MLRLWQSLIAAFLTAAAVAAAAGTTTAAPPAGQRNLLASLWRLLGHPDPKEYCMQVLNDGPCKEDEKKRHAVRQIASGGHLLTSPLPIVQLATLMMEIPPSRDLSLMDPLWKEVLMSWALWKRVGNYQSCQAHGGSHHCQISIGVDSGPMGKLGAVTGMCLPRECSAQGYLQHLGCQIYGVANMTEESLRRIEDVMAMLGWHDNRTSGAVERIDNALGPLEYTMRSSDSYCTDDALMLSEVLSPSHPRASGGAIATLCVVIIIVATVLFATMANQLRLTKVAGITGQDQGANDGSRPGSSDVSAVWAIVGDLDAVINMQRLLATFPVKSGSSYSGGQLDFLNGIRVLSTGYIILGHTVLHFAPQSSNVMPGVLNYAQSFDMTIIYFAFLSVDTFFWLSGFLMAVLVLKVQKQVRGFRGGLVLKEWGMALVHRYLRLSPVYFFALMVFINLGPYLGYGPLWLPNQQSWSWDYCHDKWWTNVLYLNNVVYEDTGKPGITSCMPWSWYLPNDMQFFWVSALVLPLYRWFPNVVKMVFGLSALGCCLANGIIAVQHDLSISVVDPTNFKLTYALPYTRMGPYAVAVLFGILWHEEEYVYKPSTATGRWLLRVCGALGLFGLLLCFLLPAFPIMNGLLLPIPIGGRPCNWPFWIQVTYNALQRTFWGVALSLVVAWVAFSEGVGAFLRTCLSWTGFQVLTRLSFGAYLWHVMLIESRVFSLEEFPAFSRGTLMTEYLAILFLAFVLSGASFVFVEKPCMNMESRLLKRLMALGTRTQVAESSNPEVRSRSPGSRKHTDLSAEVGVPRVASEVQLQDTSFEARSSRQSLIQSSSTA